MGKVLAIGDMHTKIWIIDKVARVLYDYDRVIFCGDYADDFSASPQNTLNTWNSLNYLQIKNQSKVELVKGNHDYILMVKKSLSYIWNNMEDSLMNTKAINVAIRGIQLESILTAEDLEGVRVTESCNHAA